MQIPHEVKARPDTGLYNAKLGIWLFLASEVMLFGGLFSGYIFLRLGAEPGYWPHGLLNVPVGTFNTVVLIASSVTIIMAWASLKMRQFHMYKKYMLATILCGVVFLGVKCLYEYPQKFDHFGVFIKKESLAKPYLEKYLGNAELKEHGKDPRVEITGHLLDAPAGSPYAEVAKKNAEHFSHGHDTVQTAATDDYVIQMDLVNAEPGIKHLHPSFWPKPLSHEVAVIKAEDVDGTPSMFVPRYSPYFAIYFTITGLHGLHVLGGIIVFLFFWGPGSKLYHKNPEHLTNRVEVVGLFWHFVDLVWIFVFPLFYLL